MSSRQSQPLMCGHQAKSGGLPASTAAHIFAKKLFDLLHPDAASSTYKYNNALRYLDTNSCSDRLVVVRLTRSLTEIISGMFHMAVQNAGDVISSFPVQVVKCVDVTFVPGEKHAAKNVLDDLAAEGFDSNDPHTFIVSCNVVKFWFSVCKFSEKPASTMLNQKTHNIVQLGGAVASIFPCFERMTKLAMCRYGNTQKASLERANAAISYPFSQAFELPEEEAGCDNANRQSKYVLGEEQAAENPPGPKDASEDTALQNNPDEMDVSQYEAPALVTGHLVDYEANENDALFEVDEPLVQFEDSGLDEAVSQGLDWRLFLTDEREQSMNEEDRADQGSVGDVRARDGASDACTYEEKKRKLGSDDSIISRTGPTPAEAKFGLSHVSSKKSS